MSQLPTWEEIEAAPLDILTQLFWQPIPARTPDEQARVRRMADRMAELEPKTKAREYLPAPPKPESQPLKPPQKIRTKVKPTPLAESANINLFKSLFRA